MNENIRNLCYASWLVSLLIAGVYYKPKTHQKPADTKLPLSINADKSSLDGEQKNLDGAIDLCSISNEIEG